MLCLTKIFRTRQFYNFSLKSHNHQFPEKKHFPDRCLFIFLFFLLTNKAFGGNDNYPSGARAAGMASTAVMLTDLWSNFYNQAGLARLAIVATPV